MSRITPEEVAHLAQLVRLSLDEDEAAGLQRDLERILGYVETLREIDTTDVVPTAHPIAVATPTRPDEAAEPLDPALAVANAPASAETAFLVPKVIDEEIS